MLPVQKHALLKAVLFNKVENVFSVLSTKVLLMGYVNGGLIKINLTLSI